MLILMLFTALFVTPQVQGSLEICLPGHFVMEKRRYVPF